MGGVESLVGEVVKAIENARLGLQVFGGASLGTSVNATAVALEVEGVIAVSSRIPQIKGALTD